MKKLKLLSVLVVVFALGFGIGHTIGLRRALHRIGDEMVGDQLRTVSTPPSAKLVATCFRCRHWTPGVPRISRRFASVL